MSLPHEIQIASKLIIAKAIDMNKTEQILLGHYSNDDLMMTVRMNCFKTLQSIISKTTSNCCANLVSLALVTLAPK